MGSLDFGALLHYFENFPAFIITWGMFGIAGLISFAVQQHVTRQPITVMAFVRHLFPPQIWLTKSARADVLNYAFQFFAEKFLSFWPLLFTTAAAGGSSYLLGFVLPHHVAAQVTVVVLIACSLAVFLANEFTHYVIHFAEHKIPFLWEEHKVHHSAPHLNVLTTKRLHPVFYFVERAASGFVAGIPAGFFAFNYGMSLVEIGLLGALAMRVGNILSLESLKHSHFPVNLGPFDKILISPHMHQVHHSSLPQHWDRNYGANLSIFDWLFGTAYQPKKGEKIVLGISGMTPEQLEKYNTLSGFIVMPMVAMWRKLRKPHDPTWPVVSEAVRQDAA